MQRLRLIFGERARLKVTEESSGLVVAAVEMPLTPVHPAVVPPRVESSMP